MWGCPLSLFQSMRSGFLLSCAALVLVSGVANADETAAKAEAYLKKAEIEKIVHDYLLENPEVIIEAINIAADRERAAEAGRVAEKIAENSDELFSNENAGEIGNAKGDVTMVEFFDYNCGYCKRAMNDVTALVEGDKNLRVVFIDMPVLGPSSELAAKYSLAAKRQGRYFDYHQALLSHKGGIDEALLQAKAKEIGLDVERLKKDASSSEIAQILRANLNLAGTSGITGTPGFVIGDKIIPGAVGKDVLGALIEDVRKNGG